jgi:hypothetical protein
MGSSLAAQCIFTGLLYSSFCFPMILAYYSILGMPPRRSLPLVLADSILGLVQYVALIMLWPKG